MKTLPCLKLPRKQNIAFTLLELLIVIAMVMIVAGLLLPSIGGHPRGARRIKCVNNLKQVGLAFRLWSGDNGDKFPTELTVTNGEVIESALVQTPARIFQIMSNELNAPKILICPADAPRTNFVSTEFTNLSNSQISYFVGLDATGTNPMSLLSGDRNITNGLKLRMGMLLAATNRAVGWTHELHNGAGNIGIADGHVDQVTVGGLRQAVAATGLATNRLAMP